MSEPKLISPLLDNFIMGDPISEHNGVRCCPAINKDTDDKYIIKIISVPASEIQLDALLLSGAYPDRESALSYFKTLADGIVNEINVLQNLSKLEGFASIENYQVEPMEDGSGFDVYLLSKYRKTLKHHLRRESMTHLNALNLGLDLCAALAVARRTGYLYADLKPGNIYFSDSNEYQIGDIGFIDFASLQYTSLPDRYRSEYTAPEITDAYSDLNTTIDIYALGLILYQVFNDGNLPLKGSETTTEDLPAPAYADYEMAEIILKACAPNPSMRWKDPVEMGQALVSYMQRNGAHDTPIVPVPVAEETSEGVFENTKDADKDTNVSDEVNAEDNILPENESIDDITEDSIYSEDADGNLTFLEGPVDETMNAQDASEIDYAEVTGEVSDMLQQADELIAHDAPDPVIQPELIDVPIPPPIELKEITDTEEQIDNEDSVDADNSDDSPESGNIEVNSEEMQIEEVVDVNAETDMSGKTRKPRNWIVITILVFLVASLLTVGFYFYKNYYLQTVDAITLETTENGELAVNVLSKIKDGNLSVVCTDTYGIQQTAPVIDGKAIFTELTPNSAYTVKIVIDGFHRLTGNVSTAYTTPAQTEVVHFTAVTGPEDGSVILSFAIEGPDSDLWNISYLSDDGSEENAAFAGHMVTINGLTVGKDYTFTLTPKKNLHTTGTTSITHKASAIVKPKGLVVTGCINNSLTAKWEATENTAVESWTVRCYNSSFDETLVVNEPAVSFTVPDMTADYTLEVTASGMSVSERAYVSKNSITVTNFTINDNDPRKLILSWAPTSDAPKDGWILQYTMDGSAARQVSIPSANSTTLSPVVPGCNYTFVLLTAENAVVLGGTHNYRSADSTEFTGYGVSASLMEFKMCRTPSTSNWNRYHLSDSDYTTVFHADQKASFLVKLNRAYNTSKDTIETLFVIRDENGTVIDIATLSNSWTKMWYKNYCELDIPSIPQTPGNYTISVFFNGAFANKTAFSVVE